MPDNIVFNLDAERQRRELVRKFRAAADALEKRNTHFGLVDVKFFLIAALNDCDRALDFGKPGDGLDTLLGESNG